MSLPRVPKMEQRAHKTQALEALTHLRPLLRARRNHKKYLQNGFFSGLLGVFEAPGEGEKTAEEIAAVCHTNQRQQNSFSIVWSELAMRVGLAVSTACDRFTANGCCAPVRTPS